jgi:5-(carboxyamino)imidazole ribonucleotide synthase
LPDLSAVLQAVDAHWHDYGKQARPGRKVGHATVCAPDAGQLAARLGGIARALGREAQVAPVLPELG